MNFEYTARKQANPRHSLRAFAKFMNVDHSTLSKILKGDRRATVHQIRAFGKVLGMSAEEIAVYLAAEHVPDAAATKREAQLRHWTAEALAIVGGRVHLEIVRLSREPRFRPDCRWIADQAGVSVDDVNLALTRLLRLGMIDGQWKDLTGLRPLTESAFRKLALAKVREKAAEHHISL